jgi:hypothetical protein
LAGRRTGRRRLSVCLLALLATGLLFTGQARAAALLDHRGWEMVSPVDKNGSGVQGLGEAGNLLQAAADGGEVSFASPASFGEGAQGAPALSEYLARRGEGGWSTQNVTLPQVSGAFGEEQGGNPYRLFSPDLSTALLLNGRCAAGEACPLSYSLRDSEDGALTASPAASDLRFAGASPDLRHIVFSSCVALTPGAFEAREGEGCDPSHPNLYQWSGGALSQVNFTTGEIVPTPAGVLAAPAGAVSVDGARIYWNDPETGKLWLHEGGEPERAVEGTIGGGTIFQAASADGSLAFFTEGAAGHETLYRYAAQSGTSQPIATEVKGVLGASEDRSRLYYQDATGLWLWKEGTTTEVAAAPEAAAPSDYPPATGTARVSGTGAQLAFLSTEAEALSGYDNRDQAGGSPDSELYLYEASPQGGGGSLTCVSCNTGERPLGPSTIPGAIGGGEAPVFAYKPRALAAGGRRLFFTSADALVLEDTDNRPDAYEWEAGGEGSCTGPGGCLRLISSGRSAEGATFADASADGDDAFFLTDGSLVPTDPGSVDLYDARVAGGFPAPPTPIPCEGDACQPLPSQPEDPSPGTLVPHAGNPPVAFPKPNKHRHKKHGKGGHGHKKHGRKRRGHSRHHRHGGHK